MRAEMVEKSVNEGEFIRRMAGRWHWVITYCEE